MHSYKLRSTTQLAAKVCPLILTHIKVSSAVWIHRAMYLRSRYAIFILLRAPTFEAAHAVCGVMPMIQKYAARGAAHPSDSCTYLG